MTKKILSLSLVLLAALSLPLSGCRVTSETPTAQPTPSPTESEETSTVIAPEHWLTAPPLFRADATAEVTQELNFGELHQARPGSPDTPFVSAGRQLYVIGDIDGGFRPRTNPYDLAAFGGPRADDPLGGELGGVWAQPVKALDGYVFVVEAGGERWPLLDAGRFTQTFAGVQFDYRRDTLVATRRDFVPQDRPALFTTLTLQNTGNEPLDVGVAFFAYFDLEDAWLTTLGNVRNPGETVQVDGEHLIAQAESAPDAWAVAVGGEDPPEQVRVTGEADGQRVGQLEYTAHLEPGAEQSWAFCIVVETESGADFDAAFDIARANAQMLEAESPALGHYFYAGLEMFPYWFSTDLAYGTGGLTPAGFGPTVAAHLRTGTTQAAGFGGQVPHQLSPAGSLIAVGNVQETPQFVSAVWDYYRWTGDRAFLADVYPIMVEGIFEYNLDRADRDDDGYPEGAGMVERAGMGPEKLDAACYLWDALGDLAQMAEVLGDVDVANQAQSAADAVQTTFDADWWLPENEVYANSLLRYKNKPRHDGHWTVAVPLEMGIAPAEHGCLSLARIQRDYLNEWGLVHTQGDDERVWTLPTGVLSRGAYRYGNPDLGFELLTRIAATLDHGAIGCYHELIPDGLTFIQNWSAGLFLKGTVEDLMGLDPRADQHEVTVAPQLPSAWEFAELSGVVIGDHRLDVWAERERAEMRHMSGPAPLTVRYCLIDAGPLTATLDGEPLAVEAREVAGRDAIVVEITLPPGQTVTLAWSDGVLEADLLFIPPSRGEDRPGAAPSPLYSEYR